ncbi:Immunoglobulin I-set domain-containing protein [Dirofilaria immitis]|nr:Immunoglobulin I-set domain-containing protein [Dirofilaria immitis]
MKDDYYRNLFINIITQNMRQWIEAYMEFSINRISINGSIFSLINQYLYLSFVAPLLLLRRVELYPTTDKRTDVNIDDVNDRFLGFNFTEEPTNTVAKGGRVELNCRYAISLKNIASRIEWRKDGAELGSLRSTGKVSSDLKNYLQWGHPVTVIDREKDWSRM